MILKLKMEAPDTWANGQGKELAVALANFANAGNMILRGLIDLDNSCDYCY